MLQVGFAIDGIGDRQKGRLCCDATDGVADSQLRIAFESRRHRCDDARQRCASAQKHSSKEGLAEARRVGQTVCDACQANASHGNNEGGRDKYYYDRPERPSLKINHVFHASPIVKDPRLLTSA